VHGSFFELGKAHYALGDYAGAMKTFEDAYVAKPLPLLLYNIAQLAALLGQRERAKHLYEHIAEDPNAPERADAVKRLAELESSKPVIRAPPPEPPAVTPPPSVVAPPPPVAPAPVRETVVEKPKRRTWIWAVVGVGAAVVVGGVTALAVTLGSRTVDPTPELGRGQLQ
jgi:hypothetical protein